MPKYTIHIDPSSKKNSDDIQISAAAILAEYFHADITFVKRHQHLQTADFLIKNQIWEHKAPMGGSKRTIQNNMRAASDQSSRVVIDLRRCKLHPTKALSNIKYELSKANSISQLIVITKTGKILVIK